MKVSLPKYSHTDLISEMGVLLRRSMSSFGAIANRICRARTRDRLLAVEEVRCGRGSYCNLPSKHPYPCKCPPPILTILWFTYIYTIYIYKWILRVSAYPRFWPVNFKCPWALTWENTVHVNLYIMNTCGYYCRQF